MSLFVKSSTIKFDGQDVVVKEIGVNFLLLNEDEKRDTKRVLVLHTNLSEEQVDNLSVDAFNTILNEFYKLNEKHFEESKENQGQEVGK